MHQSMAMTMSHLHGLSDTVCNSINILSNRNSNGKGSTGLFELSVSEIGSQTHQFLKKIKSISTINVSKIRNIPSFKKLFIQYATVELHCQIETPMARV